MTVKNERKKNGRGRNGLGPVLFALIIVLATYFVLFAALAAAITPQRFDIKVGSPAPRTIKANKEVIDEIATEEKRAAAANEVLSIYTVDEAVLPRVTEKIALCFDTLASGGECEDITLTASQQKAIANADSTELERLKNEVINSVSSLLEARLIDTQIPNAVTSIGDQLAADGFSNSLVQFGRRIAEIYIEPNSFYDEEATAAQRQAKVDEVEPVTRVKGEVIVSDGELVTEAQYALLEDLGMISTMKLDVTLFYGIAVIVLLLIGVLTLYVVFFAPRLVYEPKRILILSILLLLQVGISLGLRSVNVYIMPVALAGLVAIQLFEPGFAMFFNLIATLLTSLLSQTQSGLFTMTTYVILFNGFMSGCVSLFMSKRRKQRISMLFTGIIVAAGGFLEAVAVGLVCDTNINSTLSMGWMTALSGAISAVLALCTQLGLEYIFNLSTPSRLMELSNPNQPLLRRLLLEAPGTYHHSIIVANLAEAGTNAVGGNALLARVGAYYHDVGKLKRPLYFKENQMGDNPHDRTDPRVSTAILTSHPKDGYILAQRARLPQTVIDIIQQHHGDTPVLYFYDKSKKMYGDDIDIAEFRYPGPRPQSVEAAVVMLADTVEAAARSAQSHDENTLRDLVHRLVRGKLDDGQLNDCSLTLKDLTRITDAFLAVLTGVFHERIEYPQIDVGKRNV